MVSDENDDGRTKGRKDTTVADSIDIINSSRSSIQASLDPPDPPILLGLPMIALATTGCIATFDPLDAIAEISSRDLRELSLPFQESSEGATRWKVRVLLGQRRPAEMREGARKGYVVEK